MTSEQAAWWYAQSERHKVGQIKLVPTKWQGWKKEVHAHSILSNAHSTSVEVNYTAYAAVVVKLQVDG